MLKNLIVIQQCLLRFIIKGFKKVQPNMGKSWEIIKTEFNSKPVHGDDEKYIKAKIKTYSDCVITNFHNKKCQKKKRCAHVYQ